MNGRSPEQDDLFIEKHLARNIPINFMECCERIRMNLGSRMRRGHQARPIDYPRVYPRMFEALGYGDADPDTVAAIGKDITEVQVRYEAIQKTLDQSVPAKPIYNTLRTLKSSLSRSISHLRDQDRDANVRFLNEYPDDSESPSDIESFDRARSIAERAAISFSLIAKYAREVDDMIKYFDYKSGLVARGSPSKYAVLYAVHALADVFETTNQIGAIAQVGETLNNNKNAAINMSRNQRRYTGPFLDFVLAFFNTVDPSELARRNYEGFADYVRKLAAGRRHDPHLSRLLHGEVAVETILGFMWRADAIK